MKFLGNFWLEIKLCLLRMVRNGSLNLQSFVGKVLLSLLKRTFLHIFRIVQRDFRILKTNIELFVDIQQSKIQNTIFICMKNNFQRQISQN